MLKARKKKNFMKRKLKSFKKKKRTGDSDTPDADDRRWESLQGVGREIASTEITKASKD